MNVYDQQLAPSCAKIGKDWIDVDGVATFDVDNPATGEVLATLPDLGADHTTKAIDAAHEALSFWRETTAKERAVILRRWHDLILSEKDKLATILSLESGKPLKEALGEVAYGAAYIEWFAEEAKRVYGDVIPSARKDTRMMAIKQGIGVVAAITPWNFPIAMITRKAAPALAAGCCVVVKPAEATPLSAIALAKLADDAGIPNGAFSVVTASHGKDVGRVMCEDQRVRKLSFTGSTPVGKILLQQCASNVKKVSMELGGNAPFIVFDDADIDAAIEGAMASKFRNTGQTCVCSNRFFVQRGAYDEFSRKLVKRVAALKVGNGLLPDIDQGPLINQAAVKKVEALVANAVDQGASVLCGGGHPSETGTFYSPSVLADVTVEMDIAHTEIFGPVAPIIVFDNEEEAVTLANNTPFGLASYFYSRDVGRCMRVAEKLEYGMVGINEGLISSEAAPFGGVKESGLGREGSKYGIDDYTEIKYLCFGGI